MLSSSHYSEATLNFGFENLQPAVRTQVTRANNRIFCALRYIPEKLCFSANVNPKPKAHTKGMGLKKRNSNALWYIRIAIKSL